MSTTICQMYSYKGGSGRTVSTANIASILAKEHKKKVVCIDLDLEGAGLGVVCSVHNKLGQRKCVQDIFKEDFRIKSLQDFKENWWNRMCFDLGKERGDSDLSEKLFLVPARFGAFDTIEFSVDIGRFFSTFLDNVQILIKPDFILLDSASGFQDWSTLGMDFSSVLVLFFRWNDQSIEGTIEAVKFILSNDTAIKKILLVPSAVPALSLSIPKYQKIQEASERRLRIETNADINPKVSIMKKGVEEAIGLKWKENILNLSNDLEQDEKITLEDFRAVAKQILDFRGIQ
ncbi:MAG: hypothetical protein ABSA44_04960 [Bacteroidota bacterium]|jgi:MinD-like ATPase involved in chromosome partitioning or flagellar assembly